MEYRSNEIKAGCLVIFSIVLLIFVLVLVSGLDLFKKTKIYYAEFKYTSGIEEGSLVRYGGMQVGRVKEVRINDDDNSTIRFALEVDDDIPVKKDSDVFITSIGIMGEYYIEISTGSSQAEVLPPGSMLNSKEVTPLMMLTDSFDKLTGQLSVTVDQINQLLGSENQNQIHDLLVNLNSLLQDNQQGVSTMMENLNAVLANLNAMGGELDTLILKNQDSITNSINQLEMTLRESKQMMSEFRSTLGNMNQMVVSQDGNYDEIMDNLARTSRNLDEFTKIIKEKPWSLIRKSAPKEREIK